MADKNDSKQSFWTTLPGILTGAAALITAIGGLLVAAGSSGLVQWAGERENTKAPVASQSKTDGESASDEPSTNTRNETKGDKSPIVSDTEGNVTITVGD